MALSNKTINYIDDLAKKYMEKDDIPGMVVGVVYEGQVAYKKGFGTADLLKKNNVDTQTVFRIASISKLFAAIATMQLVDDGLIQLDDLANDHLTSFQLRPFQGNTCAITVKQLLTHTSGIGEIAPIMSYLNPRATMSMLRIKKELFPLPDFYKKRLGSDCKPGSKWCYANHGYAALGQLVADVRGQDFPTVVKERICDPLGMENADFRRLSHVLEKAGIAHRKGKPARDLNIITLADGGLFCNADDFGNFMAEVVTGCEKLLKPETFELMITPHHQLDERLPSMGLGFFLSNPNRWGGHRIVKHDGALLGWATSSWYAPDLQLGAFAFMNTNGAAPNHVAHSIVRHLIPDDKPTYPIKADPQPFIWPNLVGNYGPLPGFNSNVRHWVGYGARLQVYIENNTLMVKSRFPGNRWRKGIALTPAQPDDAYAFMAGHEPLLFKKDLNGRIDRIEFNHHKYFRHQ